MPTEREIESAREREQIARAMRDELQKAKEVCGEGAKAYAMWVMKDKTGREPNRIVYCCRREGAWEPPAPDDDERLTATDHPGYLFGGKTLYPFRWTLGCAFLGEYNPETAEQLAERRITKAKKALEELDRTSRGLLFPEVLDDERNRLIERTR